MPTIGNCWSWTCSSGKARAWASWARAWTGGHSQRAVVLSNYVSADIRARCMALGADAVFDKSSDLEAFFDYCTHGRRARLEVNRATMKKGPEGPFLRRER